jgi:hypothetical protein
MSKNKPKKNRKKQTARTPIRRQIPPRAGQHGAPTQAQMPRPRVTDYTVITVVPVFANGEAGPPSGSTGTYDVVFVLGIPGVSSVGTAMDIDQLLGSGDSLLAGTELRMELQAQDESVVGVAKISPNRQGRLAQVRLSVSADNFAAAEKQAHDAVMPVLSLLAFKADVPLEVTTTVMTEQATQIRRVGATLIGAVQPAPEPSGWSTPELRPFLAIYREGLNSNMPLYQALSFYKVIEGAPTFHTKRVRAANRAGDTPPSDPLAQTIPADVKDLPATTEWSRDLFTPYLGKAFAEVETGVRDTIRNAIAHLTPGRDLRVADYLDDIHGCQKVIPILRYVARQLIQNELAAVAAGLVPPSAITTMGGTS